VQCCVEPVPGAVASEHPAGAVRALGGGGKADDRQASLWIAEASDGPSPVLLAAEAPRRVCSAGLAPLDESGAAATGVDLVGEVLQGMGHRGGGARAYRQLELRPDSLSALMDLHLVHPLLD
jgi:hypothetical protein